MKIIGLDESQFTSYAFNIDQQSDQLVEITDGHEESVYALDEIGYGPDNQDAIKKDYNDAKAIEEALEKQLNADNARIKSLLQLMLDLKKTMNALKFRINQAFSPAKEYAQKALDGATKAFGALESDLENMIKKVASSQQQLGDINVKLTALLLLTCDPNPPAENVLKAHQYLRDVKKTQSSMSTVQIMFDALYGDFLMHEVDVVSGIEEAGHILR